MKNNETCKHGGVSPVSLLVELHHNQGGKGRHRCPICAYEFGYNLGGSGNWNTYLGYCNNIKEPDVCQNGSTAPAQILFNLNDNQGGTGRHKCTNCAFKKGFELGLLENGNKEISIEVVSVPLPQEELNIKINSSAHIDFIEQEIRNKHLGLLGELFIFKSEIEFLELNGKNDLAQRVKHVSVDVGDGLGYDILSYDLLGNEKKIEVKTTRSDILRPFYLTKNEIQISSEYPENYYLYRLFDFDPELNKGKYYVICGDIANSLTLDALNFIAYPKSN